MNTHLVEVVKLNEALKETLNHHHIFIHTQALDLDYG